MNGRNALPHRLAHGSSSRQPRGGRWLTALLVFLLLGMAGQSAGLDIAANPLATATLPALGGGERPFREAESDFELVIPAIDLDVAVVEAYVRGDTWDFSTLADEAAHLELTAYPGQGNNVVIGAHYELTNFVPGPFYDLDHVTVGDHIQVTFQGRIYVYQVTQTLLVDPTDVAVVYRTAEEVLTLLTCYNFSGATGLYANRYVVRAALVEES